MINYKDKVVLVTGGTRGIGKAIADCLYDHGATLLLTGTKQEQVDALNEQNQVKNIDRVTYFQVDFSLSESIDRFLTTIDKFDRIDVCINNAGINIINDFCDVSFEEFERIQQVNVVAPYKILKVIGPKMIQNGYGRIVNIASIWSVITRPGRSSYTLSKNAIVGLTKTLAIEWAQYNILVNAVSPGFTMTELTKTTNTPEELQLLESQIPAKRMAQPFEIANVVAFLCSNMNTYLTGQNITVDGGFTNV